MIVARQEVKHFLYWRNSEKLNNTYFCVLAVFAISALRVERATVCATLSEVCAISVCSTLTEVCAISLCVPPTQKFVQSLCVLQPLRSLCNLCVCAPPSQKFVQSLHVHHPLRSLCNHCIMCRKGHSVLHPQKFPLTIWISCEQCVSSLSERGQDTGHGVLV